MLIKQLQVDARGVSCPEPLVLTRKGLDQSPAGVEVLVDNATARDNVARFAKLAGYQVQLKESNGDYLITLSK